MSKKVYAIGNAHLDPVWMWRWQEGSAEAKATIRSALDRMNEYPNFRFVCSSASVFKWIEEFDPKMFDEIKQRVKEKRFIIVGGMHVQPDCNLPSGEGFARQTLYAQRYFFDRFGVTAKVGYNVDSFGHNAMLPQILKKSGMNSYIFMRPNSKENENLSGLFNWVSPDGTSVLAARIPQPYNYFLVGQAQTKARINKIFSVLPKECEYAMLFYGVGNHGGGPTKRNIETIIKYNKSNDDIIVFGDPNDFFDDVREKCNILPEWHDDLQHHASGCYSAVSEIKTLTRRSETALIKAELYSFLSYSLLGKNFPTAELRRGWENVCFNHFHDTLGGCAIEEAYDDARAFADEALSISLKLTNNALQSISWAVDTHEKDRGIPLIVFNPHPFEVTDLVRINKQSSFVRDEKGNNLGRQYVLSPTKACYMRDDTVFVATVPPLGYRTYYIQDQNIVQNYVSFFDKAKYSLKKSVNKNGDEGQSAVRVYDNSLENEFLKVKFDTARGVVVSIFNKKTNKEMLSGRGSEYIVIDESDHDTWSHGKNYFDKRIGSFNPAAYEVLENGPVRATVKIVSSYGSSTLTQYFSLIAQIDELRVCAHLDWHEKHKMLKLAFETSLMNCDAYYEMPFGVIKRPTNGEEEPMHSFAALMNSDDGLAVINDNKYSASAKDSTFYLTAIRSPLYGDHGWPRDKELPYTDQGTHNFSYALKCIKNNDGWSNLVRSAKVFNTPLENIIENHHNGTLPFKLSSFESSAKNIIVSALKRGEDGKSIVVRAYETDGKQTAVSLKIYNLPTLETEFSPYSVKTFMLADGESEWKEVLITEFEMEED